MSVSHRPLHSLLTAVEHFANPRSDTLLDESHRQVWLQSSDQERAALAEDLQQRGRHSAWALTVLLLGALAVVMQWLESTDPLNAMTSLPLTLLGVAAAVGALGLAATPFVLACHKRRFQRLLLLRESSEESHTRVARLAQAEASAQAHLDDVRARQLPLAGLDVVLLERTASRARLARVVHSA